LPDDKAILLQGDEVTHDSESDRGLYGSAESLDEYIPSGYKRLYPVIMEVSERSDKIIVIIVEPPEEKLIRGLLREKKNSLSFSE